MTENNKSFKAIRKSSGLTQLKLSKLLSLDQTTVSKWENGVAVPKITMLKPLCDLLKVDLETLVNCFEA